MVALLHLILVEVQLLIVAVLQSSNRFLLQLNQLALLSHRCAAGHGALLDLWRLLLLFILERIELYSNLIHFFCLLS